MQTITHHDGDFTIARDDFTDGADEVRTVAVRYSRDDAPVYIPTDIAHEVAAAIIEAAGQKSA